MTTVNDHPSLLKGLLWLATPVFLSIFVIMWLLPTDKGSGSHRIVAVLPEAANVIEGLKLKAGGREIGTVEKLTAVDRGHAARMVLNIDDDVWPLPQGTRFGLRFGGTAAVSNRSIRVDLGPAGAPPMRDGQTIPAKDFATPVEVDQVLAQFDGGRRTNLKAFLNRSGTTLDRSRAGLKGTLTRTPQALEQATAVFEDLNKPEGVLDTVVRRTDAVVDAIHRSDPDVQALLTGAASTVDAIADEQQGLRQTLDQLPAALRQTRSTLGQADGTLERVGELAVRLRPGVRELRRTAAPLDGVLQGVQQVTPDANATLQTVRSAGPGITSLLDRATEVAPQLGSIGDKAVENLKCIRPYAPEIGGLTMTWADFMSWNDDKDKVLRATVQSYIPAQYNNVPLTPAAASNVYSGLKYGFPRPPGYLAGQPWFQEDCGAGKDSIDPAKDAEAGNEATG